MHLQFSEEKLLLKDDLEYRSKSRLPDYSSQLPQTQDVANLFRRLFSWQLRFSFAVSEE